ncbi:MAG: D-xylose ABC transporter ATP-binding protein [Planctomycetaceae bacterium]|nr:D-xylose ABC transporter ATP-binding protein [Planctomycetaceae bacterium]HCK41282.1 D-xylose ABC transporter ATP-binding protein [Planctomycetaceae bacterium]
MPSSVPKLVLEARGVGKQFGSVCALQDVSLQVRSGEVLAVVGENGAGKSTLMKILAGVIQPTTGSLLSDGNPVEFAGVEQATDAGIALIHQELNLAPNLDVGANIFLGREPRRFGLIAKHELASQAKRHLASLGLDVSPTARLGSLSIGRQQLVEIAKALSTDARVLIMDEPTSSLSLQEANKLYEVIRQLKRSGVAIVYISHRMQEVVDLADRVVVLRDGEFVGELDKEHIDRDQIVRMMVGRDISQFYQRQPHPQGKVVISASRLRTSAYPDENISFSVHAGEIVGLAGLVGAGRTELLTTLFGETPALGGDLTIDEKDFVPQNPAEAIQEGVALAPEDRRESGLMLEVNVERNLSLVSLKNSLNFYGFVRSRGESELCRQAMEQLAIKPALPRVPVRLFSGGNQQKVVLGKWLATQPRVLLLDEPTRGIDIGSKSEIYRLMHELAGQGVAILFASSDMEEIVGLSDRVIVMHQGRITGELNRDQLSEERIMKLAVASVSQMEADASVS